MFLMIFWDVSAQSPGPELIVQTGHSLDVHSLSFSADGKLLASSSSDRTAKLWDAVTGTELRSFNGCYKAVAISPDSQMLACGGMDNAVNLWNVSNGEFLWKIDGFPGIITSLAFSPDGKTLAIAESISSVTLWNIATKSKKLEIKTLDPKYRELPDGSSLPDEYSYVSVAFSPNGTTLVTGGWDNNVKLWDAATGKLIFVCPGHSLPVTAVAFASNGRLIASGSSDKTIILWDAANGRKLQTLVGHGERVTSIAFSPNGNELISGSADKTIRVWDVLSGKPVNTLKGNETQVLSVACSPDGGSFASGFVGGRIKIWDAQLPREKFSIAGVSPSLRAMTFSPDGSVLASSSNDGIIRLWDIATDQGLRSLSGDSGWIESLAFSSDGKLLASGSECGGVKIRDVSTGKVLQSLFLDSRYLFQPIISAGLTNCVSDVKFSPDDKVLASANWDGFVRLWTVADGKPLGPLSQLTFGVKSVAFSSDGRLIAAGGRGEIAVWQTESRTRIKTIKDEKNLYDEIIGIWFSPDGETLLTTTVQKGAKLWDWKGERELPNISNPVAPWIYDSVLTAVTIKDRSYTAKFLGNGISLTDSATGRPVASLFAFGENDWLVTEPNGLFDGTPNAWKQIMWRFDNNTFSHAPIEAFFKEFYRPGLLQDILQGKDLEPPSKDLSKIDIRQPMVEITSIDGKKIPTNGGISTTNRSVKVRVELTDNHDKPLGSDLILPSGARDMRLFRNGSLVKIWRENIFDPGGSAGCIQLPAPNGGPRKAVCETEVQITSGKNQFSAYAFNYDNVKSTDSRTIEVTGDSSLKQAGTLYVLAIGINKYDFPTGEHDLRFAVPDIRDMAAKVEAYQAKLDQYVKTEIVKFIDSDATRSTILLALARFVDDSTPLPSTLSGSALANLQKIKHIHPEDAILIYYSGHGMARGDRFYLIPNDGFPKNTLNSNAYDELLQKQSISDMDLVTALEKIQAGRIMMVIDACNSGAIEGKEKRRGPMNSIGLAQLAYEKGMYILTASQSYQSANEAAVIGDKQINHGFLTFALLESLNDKTVDKNADGSVTEREWFDHAVEYVPRIQKEAAKNIKGSEPVDIAGESEVFQTPRLFLPRDIGQRPFVVTRQ